MNRSLFLSLACLVFACTDASGGTAAARQQSDEGISQMIMRAAATTGSGTWLAPTDGYWSDSGNWYKGIIPGATDTNGMNNDTATFNASGTINVTVDVRSLGTVKFAAGAGTFTLHDGRLYLINGAQIYIEINGIHTQSVTSAVTLSPTAGGTNAFYNNSDKSGANLVIAGSVTAFNATPCRLDLGGIGIGTVSGAISDGANGGILSVQKVGTGTWTVSAANTYTGTTTIMGGTLQLGNGGTSGSFSTASKIANNSILAFNRSDSITQGSEFSGSAITGTGAITKLGGGVLTLNAGNTYTGTTSVMAGTLLINGNQSLATGAVTVAAGSYLGGTGAIGGAVTINNGGFITGATNGSVGALTLASTASFTGAASFLVDLTGAVSDRLNVAGALSLSGTADKLIFSGSTDGHTDYVLATYGSLSGTFNTVTNLPSGYELVYGLHELDLVSLTSAPEPSTWAAAVLALVAVVLAGRRRAWRAWQRTRRF